MIIIQYRRNGRQLARADESSKKLANANARVGKDSATISGVEPERRSVAYGPRPLRQHRRYASLGKTARSRQEAAWKTPGMKKESIHGIENQSQLTKCVFEQWLQRPTGKIDRNLCPPENW